MSHGKPVIGCNAGGVPEVVTEGVTGLLAEPSDYRSLAEKSLLCAKILKCAKKWGSVFKGQDNI